MCTTVNPSIKSISAKGGSILPSAILADVKTILSTGGVYTTDVKVLLGGNVKPNLIVSAMDIKSITAKTKKYKDAFAGGYIGFVTDPTALEVSAPNIATIDGHAGVSGVFIAGLNAQGELTGVIKTIKTKTGALLGVAYVLETSKEIKFKPAQGSFEVLHAKP